MIPRDPGKRIRIRRCLFATQAIFLVTKILVSVLVTGDFISLVIQCFAIFVFLSYVPWALVCDFRTAKEVRQEWERIRRVRRGEEHVGESTLENKGKKNRWRSDRAWQECLFLCLQGLCWLLSAIFAGIQGGPTACQEYVLQNAVISGLDRLVPDRAAAQFCDGMTANIALSCLGVVFTLLWLWWVYYSVKTLRKFEQTTKPNGEEVLIVREKVWRKSMARLLRRDEDDDVNGIKRIVTGGLVDLIELESRRSVNRHPSERSRRHTRENGTNGNGTGTGGALMMSPGFGLHPSTPRPSHESLVTSRSASTTGRRSRSRSPSPSPNFNRRDTNEILQSLPQRRGDMPPPPYIGQPLSDGATATSHTQTQTLSSSGEGTNTSQESPASHQALLTAAAAAAASSPPSGGRPLPLAPPQVERVVERKMDEMASASGTYSGGTMDAFTATRLGLGPAASGAASGSGSGTGHKMEYLVDRKLGSFQDHSPPPTATATAGPSGQSGETMEQLVDRKISDHHGYPAPAPAPSSPSHARPSSYAAEITTSPMRMHHPHGPDDMTSTWPGSNPPPHFNSLPFAAVAGGAGAGASRTGKGKAAEAGFSLDYNGPDTSAGSTRVGEGQGEMSLEDMIERKMAAMRAASASRPPPVTSTSAESTGNTPTKSKKSRGKGKGKGRPRAGSDPGPKLAKHDETDEDESGEG